MQLLASGVVDFEKDLDIMTAMHNHKVYPPRFIIEVNGERATAPSVVEVEFTGVNGDLNIEVILPLPIQPPVHKEITGTVRTILNLLCSIYKH